VEVTGNLYGELRKDDKKATFTLGLPAGTSVSDVLDFLKVPAEEPVAIVVNGLHMQRSHRLADADVLSMFSMGAFGQEASAAS